MTMQEIQTKGFIKNNNYNTMIIVFVYYDSVLKIID